MPILARIFGSFVCPHITPRPAEGKQPRRYNVECTDYPDEGQLICPESREATAVNAALCARVRQGYNPFEDPENFRYYVNPKHLNFLEDQVMRGVNIKRYIAMNRHNVVVMKKILKQDEKLERERQTELDQQEFKRRAVEVRRIYDAQQAERLAAGGAEAVQDDPNVEVAGAARANAAEEAARLAAQRSSPTPADPAPRVASGQHSGQRARSSRGSRPSSSAPVSTPSVNSSASSASTYPRSPNGVAQEHPVMPYGHPPYPPPPPYGHPPLGYPPYGYATPHPGYSPYSPPIAHEHPPSPVGYPLYGYPPYPSTPYGYPSYPYPPFFPYGPPHSVQATAQISPVASQSSPQQPPIEYSLPSHNNAEPRPSNAPVSAKKRRIATSS
ncbi:hypothetical protein L596_000142 [Steinernema carpocapsae]|uniref:Uncharacterized protein n=1 Tax=Steinernema carpocapsae TaxID=34508 RepID=A0A4U8UJE5_STECR|nr:hypothetical protein L596_000142 [Steinernema carpocapsae]